MSKFDPIYRYNSYKITCKFTIKNTTFKKITLVKYHIIIDLKLTKIPTLNWHKSYLLHVLQFEFMSIIKKQKSGKSHFF